MRMGIRKKPEKPRTEEEEAEDFVIDLRGVEVLPNTGEMVYEPLGIRSPGGVMGAKLENLVTAYESGSYMDTFLEIRKYVLQNQSACLGFVKLSIASHIRWWLDRGTLPSKGDKERMKAAFTAASKANTVTEAYFTFAADVVKEIHGDLPEDRVVEKIKLYTGEDSPVVADDEGYSGIHGDGWYPALSMKSLTRLPNTGKKLFEPLGIMCPQTDD